uniref:Transcription initiation factor IIF subunit alpha n=1 Tax=Entomoneis paludosa TaxID=265537 RepID=A0A7S2YEV3_9STRA
MDYDANEQFDDDDVDLGEAEQIIDSSGFKDDDIDDEMDDSDEEDGDVQDGGAEGLASLAGFKALLAKARGETPPETEANPVQAKQAADQKRADNRKREKVDHMSKIIAADEKARLDAERKAAQQRGGVIPNPGQSADDAAMNTADAEMMDAAAAPQEQQPTAAAPKETPLVDANGFRIITLEAVRREIWLNHGSIPMKRLMKIFEVKKKSAQERQDKFREVVKELCTMKQDPVNGRMLVLKQHYSKG